MTTISNPNIGTGITICISDLGDKSMDAFIPALNIELWKDHCVRCMLWYQEMKSLVSYYLWYVRSLKTYNVKNIETQAINNSKVLYGVH